MRTDDNKQLIRDIYIDLSKGNGEALFKVPEEDVRWTIMGSTGFSGSFRGRQEIMTKVMIPLMSFGRKY